MNKKALAIAGGFFAAIPVFLAAPGRASAKKKAPFIGRNFAHRGLHTRDKAISENSLRAFRMAAESGYGIELDVQLSKDGQVVVFHDDTLNRVCGVDDRVENKTYAELSRLSLCGTEDRIPLFSEVLKAIDGRVPIICELKTGKRNAELCEKTYDLISGYAGEICIESFDPFILKWFRFHARELFRGQLAMPAEEYKTLRPSLAFLLGHCFMNFISRPQFIAYKIGKKPFSVSLSELMGAARTAWVSHEPANEAGKDCVIFEYYKPKVRFK